MKKITILLIALMIIILGFITGCTQQSGTSNNNKENTDESNFVNWTSKTDSEIKSQLQQIHSSWDSNWDDCLRYIRQGKSNIDIYINQSKNFSLGDVLDSARFWYIEYLNAYKQVYELWDLAVQDYLVGRITDGNSHAQEGLDLEGTAKTYLTSCALDISTWQKRHGG